MNKQDVAFTLLDYNFVNFGHRKNSEQWSHAMPKYKFLVTSLNIIAQTCHCAHHFRISYVAKN